MENLTKNLSELKLYRKRLIPEECIALPDDRILRCDEDVLVTSWKTIRPKKNMDHGFSCFYLKEGYKISKFYQADGTLLYYYCDIISPYFEKNTNELIVTDLLVDVIIYPDGFVKVVDVDELVTAQDDGKLSLPELKQALMTLDNLLNKIYLGKLPELLAPIEEFEKTV
ncbi:MAG: DUF402 domain-containing protein [Lachnospiraceae bacterium]|nr:DUF402 domain-containing protein [Lachnospiraceae bacterium]